MHSSHFILIICLLYLVTGCQPPEESTLTSPDGKVKVSFFLVKPGKPSYSITFNNKVVIDTSGLGYELKNSADLRSGFRVDSTVISTYQEVWERPWGETKKVLEHYNQLQVYLGDDTPSGRKMIITFRAFNDGVGFRYLIPGLGTRQDSLFITSEKTEFHVPGDPDAWWIKADFDSYEKRFRKTRLSQSPAVGTPLTMQRSDGICLSLHEADLTDYAGMTLTHEAGATILKSELAPWPDGIKVKTTLPMESPWRTIQLSENPAGLIESNLIVNLNEPSKMEDTSWIKPLKYVGIWWSLHLFLETWASGDKHGATTENAKRYIDFAAKHNIQGVLVEGWNQGWDTWLDEDSFDYTTPYPDFDLEEVVRYAKENDVTFVGHQETGGNIPEFEARMDSVFAMYKKLGVEAIKTGYAGKIRVPGQSHHGQFMVNHYRKVLEMAAESKIMLNAHEPIKDTGIRRTWPNMMTREGVRGMEWNAWSKGNTPSHTTTLAFTRMLSGPVDYTPGIFDVQFKRSWDKMPKWNEFKDRGLTLRVRTTLAKQLALMVVLYSPMVMAADMIENYEGQPAFKFVEDLDVDWEEQRVVNAAIGEYVTLARKAGERWFLGSITDEQPREFDIQLDFLDKDKVYRATIYRDGKDAHWETNPYRLEIADQEVDHQTVLNIDLAPGGGQAIVFKPKH